MPTSLRTTLSLPDKMGARVEQLAREERISTVQLIRSALEHFIASKDAFPEARVAQEARTLSELGRNLDNPYQELVGLWRITRTHRQVKAIASYQLDMDAWSAEIYLMKILTELIHSLERFDDFLTISNIRFWSDTASPPRTGFLGRESDHFYLGAQREAIGNGMRLHRVFVVSDKDLQENRHVLKPHFDFVRGFGGDVGERVKVDVLQAGNDLDEALRHYGHFACLRRRKEASRQPLAEGSDEGCLIVRPMYDAAARITSLRFIFSRGAGNKDAETKFYIDRFREAVAHSEPLVGLFTESDATKPALI